MECKGHKRVRIDPDAVTELEVPSDFTKRRSESGCVDARVLEIARIFGRQAAREDLERTAANDNEPTDNEVTASEDSSRPVSRYTPAIPPTISVRPRSRNRSGCAGSVPRRKAGRSPKPMRTMRPPAPVCCAPASSR